jgi:hypothetical protein|mmetsp:Transcript_72673/g.115060  ORF Transcript_72673/g.115060 Transcript_72673/m.115060 type:complete len:267 (+) Transcript_72673:115-915(+)|eukprot:CAMPEP_0169098072 /NCGR_PEP_ID=MMETSP1015-20121227/19844_1 /TAXON_ID=342587 /ORGANISM="Karlodinium micrum, Strain CCMP2283" /LENGTH=266 /DNA_ID=CAMNT_0009158893 /DNA_START=217 /DNA_END=1017 /DNA_ORIENTATION=+
MTAKKEEEKVDAKDLPWMQASERTGNIGWDNGEGLSQANVNERLRQDKALAREIKLLKKGESADAGGDDAKREAARNKAAARKKLDDEMPANWQAWYGTIPGLDGKQTYRQATREEGRAAKMRKLEVPGAASFDAELSGMSLDGLRAELDKVQREAAAQESRLRDTEASIARYEELDRIEEDSAKLVRRRLAEASYQHGIMEGKIRSSDLYFGFIYEDTQNSYRKKVMTMQRSSSLMLGEIATMKKDVRTLLQQAREQNLRVSSST